MVRFDRPYMTFYWSAIVTVPFSSYLTLNNIVTLKSGLVVTRDHWKGVRPYWPLTTARRYRPHQKTTSATQKINIGHNHIGQNRIGHKIYGECIWRHRVDTSLFRVVHILNLNWNRALDDRPHVSPVIAKMNVTFFKTCQYYYLLPPHSRHALSLLGLLK